MNGRGQSMCSAVLWNGQSNGCVQNLYCVIHLACLNSRRDFSFSNPSLFPDFILNWWLLCWLFKSRRDHIPRKKCWINTSLGQNQKKTVAELLQSMFKGCEITCICHLRVMSHALGLPSCGDTGGAENSTLKDADTEWKMKNRVEVCFL